MAHTNKSHMYFKLYKRIYVGVYSSLALAVLTGICIKKNGCCVCIFSHLSHVPVRPVVVAGIILGGE